MTAAPPEAGASRVLIVIPTFNERANLADLVPRLFAAAPGVELLVVDDDSPDGTGELCRQLGGSYPRLHLLERKSERGLGRAYVAGLKWGLAAGYDVVGTMDADHSHDPAHLPALLALAAAGADVVVGSRYVPGGGTRNWGLRRRLLSWFANRFAALLLGLGARDLTSGYRLYRADSLRTIDLDAITSTGYSFLVEVLYRLQVRGARVAESPILFVDRTSGKSKLSPREIPRGALSLLRLRFSGAAQAPRAAAGPTPPASAPGNPGR
ncbi:MAG TPA: polyprenol monophosphomannose synthase [Thermoanaerobaculia bacterium]|nr:polyprenol monophosphomannose synthase [Thermoanaerobaculia bacterium]